MQTFLPYPDFKESLACLDYRRLGKQRVEALQILKALRDPNYGWQNHPAVKMWRGYEDALAEYYNCCLDAWQERGYQNNMKYMPVLKYYPMPAWLGNPQFHASHRSNLLRKDSVFYSQYGWSEPDDLEYVWPRRSSINAITDFEKVRCWSCGDEISDPIAKMRKECLLCFGEKDGPYGEDDGDE